MNRPSGQWGFSLYKRRKNLYVSISKDGYCDFTRDDHNYIIHLFGGQQEEITEGMFRLPPNFDAEDILVGQGFQQDTPRSMEVLNYMKEHGSLR